MTLLPETIIDFKKVRHELKIKLREVETDTGISNPYLSQLENGKIDNPSYRVVAILNNYYFNKALQAGVKVG